MILKINIYSMKYLKKYNLFLEDEGGGVAYADAGIGGMGDVINSQPGTFAGTTGTSGSGDVSFGLRSLNKKKKNKKKKRNSKIIKKTS